MSTDHAKADFPDAEKLSADMQDMASKSQEMFAELLNLAASRLKPLLQQV